MTKNVCIKAKTRTTGNWNDAVRKLPKFGKIYFSKHSLKLGKMYSNNDKTKGESHKTCQEHVQVILYF